MRSGDAQAVSWRALLQGGNSVRLFIVCFGVWLHAADGLLVTTMIPKIVPDIGGARFVAWTVALYEIGSIAAGASVAVIAARTGLRRAMMVAAMIYAAGCVVSALAPNMGVMLAGRLAQGLGGGGLAALSFVSVSLLFPRVLMPRAIAAVSALWGVSAFVGPLIGGLFADAGLWRGGFWSFAAQAIVLAAAIGMTGALDQRQDVPAATRLPLWRLCVLSLGVLAVAAAGIAVSPLTTPLLVAVGLLLLVLFLRMDGRRTESRLLPRRTFDPRDGVGAALLMIVCFSVATVALTVYGPLVFTRLYGVSALTAGYIVALSAIGWSVTAVIVSGVRERFDGALILSGMGVLTISIAGFAIAVPNGLFWAVLVFATFEGVGFGMAWTFILRRVTALAEAGDVGRVAAAMPTLQRLGYALGAAYVGIIANAAGFADGATEATMRAVGFWIFAGSLPLAAVGLYAAWRFVSATRERLSPV